MLAPFVRLKGKFVKTNIFMEKSLFTFKAPCYTSKGTVCKSRNTIPSTKGLRPMNTTKHLTANRCISAVLLLAMLLAMGIMLAGCNAAVVPDAGTLPTAAPTATPDICNEFFGKLLIYNMHGCIIMRTTKCCGMNFP